MRRSSYQTRRGYSDGVNVLEPVPLSVAADASGRVVIGIIRAEPVRVAPAADALDGEMATLASELVSLHAGKAPSEIDGLAPARELYRAFGIDPTRTRPSSEALLRRVVQGKRPPRVLNAVDVANLCALRFLLSLGLYDVAKIRGAVTLRTGRPRESYAGIRKEEVHLEGRLALADDEGAFGNPTSDSLRTCVDEGTRSLLMVIFAPANYAAARMEEHVTFARRALERHTSEPGSPMATSGAVLAP